MHYALISGQPSPSAEWLLLPYFAIAPNTNRRGGENASKEL